ncbi:3208_t:CDS:2 [Acaulospora colombiana]|uniref:3208_t:CDS:1 n=1 Tax=Acaulospora colombiana TaxID=27376 RepID=A0ACA9K2B8_9GLOM|nr:3208_t:CDS:2 [Acaulospora colombiana]
MTLLMELGGGRERIKRSLVVENKDKGVTIPLAESSALPKLRNIAPAPQGKPDYDVYHIPKGYEVLLVPKSSADASPSFAGHLSTSPNNVIPLSPAPSESSTQDSPKSSSKPSPPNSSWRKRRNNGHIPRPKNCFMAYREQIQHKVLEENPGMNNKLVSVIAAKMWKEESEEVKQYWRERAQQLKLEHMMKYPNYKFAPKKKQSKTSSLGVKPTKAIKKPTDTKVLTEELAKDMLKRGYGNHEGPVLWGHYRSSSLDSIGSWTSDSNPPTPPYIENSPPTFETNDPCDRSVSPLRYETCSKIDANNSPNSFTHGDWSEMCDQFSSIDNGFFDSLLPPMEFSGNMNVDTPASNGSYYFDEDDEMEYGEGFIQPDSSQLLNSLVLPGQNTIHQGYRPHHHQRPLY